MDNGLNRAPISDRSAVDMSISVQKVFVFLILLLLPWCGRCLAGERVLVVYNSAPSYVMDTIEEFEEACTLETEHFLTAGMSKAKVLKEIRKRRPTQILVLGFVALYKIDEITDIPVIYVLVEDPRAGLAGRKNFTGVLMQNHPEKRLAGLKFVLPGVKCVGMLSSKKFEPLAREVRAALARAGVKLIEKSVDEHPETPVFRLLDDKMSKAIDVFWLLPVKELVTEDGFELLISRSTGHFNILAYTELHMMAGAFVAVYGDIHMMGREAAQISNRIRAGEKVENMPPIATVKSYTRINNDVAKKRGIKIPMEVLAKVLVYPDG